MGGIPSPRLRQFSNPLPVNGYKSDAIVLSLTEIVRRKRIDELKAMRGKVLKGIPDIGIRIEKEQVRNAAQ